jgi:hypothetical protein
MRHFPEAWSRRHISHKSLLRLGIVFTGTRTRALAEVKSSVKCPCFYVLLARELHIHHLHSCRYTGSIVSTLLLWFGRSDQAQLLRYLSCRNVSLMRVKQGDADCNYGDSTNFC